MSPQPGGAGGCGGEIGGSRHHTCPRVAGTLSEKGQGGSTVPTEEFRTDHKPFYMSILISPP